jgi:uncharacterized protein
VKAAKEGSVPEYLHPGVYVQEESSGAKPIEAASTSTACFVGTAPRGQPNRPTFVTNWLQYERAFGGLDKKHEMPLAVYQFFNNGGKRAYVLRVLREKKRADNDTNVAKAAEGKVTPEGFLGEVLVRAAGGGVWGNDLRVSFRYNAFSHNKPGADGADDSRPYLYDLLVEMKDAASGQFKEVEAFGPLGGREDGDKFYASLINRDSSYVRVVPDDKGKFAEATADRNVSAKAKDEPGEWKRAAGAAPAPGTPAAEGLSGGSDGPVPDQLDKADYDASLKALDRVDDASILVVPGADTEKNIHQAGVDYVSNRALGDMIYIVDPPKPPPDQSAEDQIAKVKDFVKGLPNKSSYAALYFPWVEVADPYSKVSGAKRLAAPSGMIAGLYARTDNTRGVWKAAQVTDGDQDALNPIGVNCVRQFPSAGIVVWGARTLSTQSNPEYRYVPVRRMAMFLKTSLYRGTQWVVFEPNDEPLWGSVRFNLNAFMLSLFRSGAFQGGKPADAYLVKCDADNNIQATIDAGQVHIMVGFAPLKPAEFVIIHLQQIRKQ